MTEIHTVTAIPHHPDDPRTRDLHLFPRCLAYYPTREEARMAVSLYCDDEAGYYTHLIIERYTPGIYPLADQEEWFERRDGKWVPIEQPEWARQVVNYVMG